MRISDWSSDVCSSDLFQQRRGLGAGVGRALARAFLQDGMDLIPELLVADGLMLAGIARAFVDGLAEVEPVAEQLVQEPLLDRLAALVQGAALHQLPALLARGSQLDKPPDVVTSPTRPGPL